MLSPTRELALQTAKVIKELGRFTNLRCAILVGGDSMEAQFAELAANPDIIIATPGKNGCNPFSDCLAHSKIYAHVCRACAGDLLYIHPVWEHLDQVQSFPPTRLSK